jgi:myo-inositol-1(or 4)-monophosphatase
MPRRDLAPLLDFAGVLADAARAAILPHFRAAHRVADKGAGSFDPVTEADEAAERAMRALIAEHYPQHGVLGEELGEAPAAGPYRWILDPIDGTRAFVAGLPSWGVLIGLYCDGRPLIGVIDQPYLDERYLGWNDGAELIARGVRRPLRTRACAGLADAILSSTSPDLFAGEEAAAFARARKRAKLTRYGFDCYAYAMVAAGHIDCVIESGLKVFDIAALIPIVTGAGGVVCTWTGADPSQGGRILACGDPRVRDAAIEALGL